MSVADEIVAKEETVIHIPLSDLHPFPNHPFKVRDDDAMSETVESVMEYGILTPAIVRPREAGGYEIVAGHRRRHACEIAGLVTLPSIVRDLDDDMATILMVDSNIQREDVLPSEKAQAYKMKLDAIKHQGKRRDRTCDQVGHKLNGKKSVEIIAEESGESKTQVQRYIRLAELIPQFQQMVDDKTISMTAAVELSHLNAEEQQLVLDVVVKDRKVPSLSQAQQLRKLSQTGKLDAEALYSVMIGKQVPRQTVSSMDAPLTSAKGAVPPQKAETSFHPRDAPVEPSEQKEAASQLEQPFKLEEKSYATIQESVMALKDMTKDCSCTPDIFLATIAEFVKRFQGEINWYSDEYYAPVFPALSPVQLRYLRQQMDTIRDAADQLYNLVERTHEHE